jgi:predicted nuclease of predicted toxin-antitoxin system
VKRVLFDEDLPRQLRRDLPEFEIRTVQEEGWSSVHNGELLRLASTTFAVLLTADQRLQYQQNLARFTIGVVVIAVRDTRLPHLRTLLPELRDAIATVDPGSLVVVPSFAPLKWPRIR